MSASKIRVVHISTFSRGGAAVAAHRIHSALLKNGIDSQFVIPGKNLNINLTCYPQLPSDNSPISFVKKLSDKIKWRLQYHLNIIFDKREFFLKNFDNIRSKLECENATMPFSNSNILTNPTIQNADIIHLHWIAGFLDYPSFFKDNVKPVVWTLHDMNPLQGLYHYKGDEQINEAISSDLNKNILAVKQQAVRNRKSNLSVVSPSMSLLKETLKNKAFKKARSYHIPNTLDTQLFSPDLEITIKNSLNISKENTVLLFVSQHVENHRKGFDILVKALNNLKNQKLTLLTIGDSDDFKIDGLDVRFLGSIEDDTLLRKYYSLADAFIIPSREDNLPNVMLEAMACGTPVLSFNVGGMIETITNGFNGLKADKVSAEELVKVINEFIKTKENYNPQAIRNFALENFSENIIAEKYIEVYKSVIANREL